MKCLVKCVVTVPLAFGIWFPYDSAAVTVVFGDQASFEASTGAVALTIPNAATAFPGTTCGAGDIGATGIGSSITMPFASNSLTVTGAGGSSLCIFDEGTVIRPLGNTIPDVMTANTIVVNGEDDFVLTFNQPVQGLGLNLLTNFQANELATLLDSAGNIVGTVSFDALTSANTRVFVGFTSSIPFSTFLLDTVGGAVQNEGIEGILVGAVPEASTILLMGVALSGLVAWRFAYVAATALSSPPCTIEPREHRS